MKEIIVIEGKDLKCAEDKNYVIAHKEKCKVEKYPTNWEELKDLCKDITLDLKICKDGTIYCYEYLLTKNRTPAQMWQIIKNLIGE